MSLPLIIFVTSSHQMFTHSIDNLTHPFTPSSHHTVLAMCGNDWTRVKRTKSISDRCISIKPLRVWPPLSTAAVFIFVSSGRLRTGNWMDWNVLWGRDFASSNFTLPSLWRHKLLGKLDVDWATSQHMMHACMPVYTYMEIVHSSYMCILHVTGRAISSAANRLRLVSGISGVERITSQGCAIEFQDPPGIIYLAFYPMLRAYCTAIRYSLISLLFGASGIRHASW